MRLFVPIDEHLLLELWMQNPEFVTPFRRPFCPLSAECACLEVAGDAQLLLNLMPAQQADNDA